MNGTVVNLNFPPEALRRSERASKFFVDCHVKEFFKQPVPPDWELPEWINEGDELSFEGRIEFGEIFCSVPINSAQPLELAGQLARRELAVEQFGQCTLTDADHSAANINPKTASAKLATWWCSKCRPAEACGKRGETRI